MVLYCIDVCMYACIHPSIHTYTYIHTYILTDLHTYIHTYLHTCIHTYTYTHTHTHTYTYTYTYIYIYIHTYIHTYTHTYIHTYDIYTHAYLNMCVSMHVQGFAPDGSDVHRPTLACVRSLWTSWRFTVLVDFGPEHVLCIAWKHHLLEVYSCHWFSFLYCPLVGKNSDMQLTRNYTSAAAFLLHLEKSENKKRIKSRKAIIELWDMLLTNTLYTGPSGMSKVEPKPPKKKKSHWI